MECLYVTHSPREVYALIYWLPDDCALSASMRGGREFLGWTWDRIMATLHLEVLENQRHDFIRAHLSKEQARALKPPKPIDFPGRPKTEETPSRKTNMLSFIRAVSRATPTPSIQ